MAGSKVTVDNLAQKIAEELANYSADVGEGVKQVVDKTTKETLKTLESTSPVNPKSRRKHYKTKWASKTMFESRLQKRNTIHNKDPQLPHLLEKPHQTRSGGRTRAQPHIAPAEAQAIKSLEEGVKKVVENGGV